jgi:hypothetical protein
MLIHLHRRKKRRTSHSSGMPKDMLVPYGIRSGCKPAHPGSPQFLKLYQCVSRHSEGLVKGRFNGVTPDRLMLAARDAGWKFLENCCPDSLGNYTLVCSDMQTVTVSLAASVLPWSD